MSTTKDMSKKTKTIRIQVSLGIGFANANHEDHLDVEVPENATDQEIEALCQQETEEWANNYIDFGFHIVTDNDPA